MYEFVDQPVDRLSQGSRFILWTMRNWTSALAAGRCPPDALAASFAGMGALEAPSGVHLVVAALNSDATRKLILLPNACRNIGEDEAILLALWGDSVDPTCRDCRQATLDPLVRDGSATIGSALDAAASVLIDAELAPIGLERTEARRASL